MSGDDAAPPGVCSHCSGQLADSARGPLCLRCSFAGGLAGSTRIGGYDVLQPLTAGGTGEVYIARELEHGDLVAIKIARPELLESAEAVAAYRNGFRIQKALRHVVPIHEVGTHEDGRPYAVMPLLPGGTLADAQNRVRYRSASQVIPLLLAIGEALQHAHQRGVLHCDLKPDNVLFDERGEPFVSDFGLARIVHGSELSPATSFAGGTPGWMSPEQLERRELTTGTDIFGLGVLLYWLLTERMPFGVGEASFKRVTCEPAPPLRRFYAGPLAFELEQICSRALQFDPERRYRSAAELCDELRCTQEGRPIAAERRRPARRAFKWMRRHRLATFALLEIGMLLIYLSQTPLSLLSELKGTVLEQLSFSALAQAGSVMNELRATQRRLRELALDAEIVRLVEQHDAYAPAPALAGRSGGAGGWFVGVFGGRAPARAVAAGIGEA